MNAVVVAPVIPHFAGQWTDRMRQLAVGESFTFDRRNRDTVNGIRVRLKRRGEAMRFEISKGSCTRVA